MNLKIQAALPDGTDYAVEWLEQVAEGINGGEDALQVNAPLIVAYIDALEAELANREQGDE